MASSGNTEKEFDPGTSYASIRTNQVAPLKKRKTKISSGKNSKKVSSKQSRSTSPKKASGAQKHKGAALFNQVVKMTGIPAKNIKSELKHILERKNVDVNNLTLEELRRVAASYLREVMGSILDRSHTKRLEH